MPVEPDRLLVVDESRNVVIYDKDTFHAPAEQRGFLVRDATTLGLIGEFAPGVFNQRWDFALYQTFRERTVLVFSRGVAGVADVGRCSTTTPRIDVFDGKSLGVGESHRSTRTMPPDCADSSEITAAAEAAQGQAPIVR